MGQRRPPRSTTPLPSRPSTCPETRPRARMYPRSKRSSRRSPTTRRNPQLSTPSTASSAWTPPQISPRQLAVSYLGCAISCTTNADRFPGHLFCHTCLMEALIAGENRGGPGEPRRSQCPVCRKNISRTKPTDVIPLLLMKGLRTQPRKTRPVVATTSPTATGSKVTS